MSNEVMQIFYDIQPFFWLMVCIILLVLYLRYQERKYIISADIVEVEIMDYQVIHDHSSTMYRAVFRYDYQGQRYQNTAGAARPVKLYTVGSIMQAYVQRDNPQESRLIGAASESSLKIARIIMTGVMILTMLIFLAALIAHLL